MITIDDREYTQHPDIEKLLDPIPVKVERMEAADYAFLNCDNEPVGIERCEVSNFVQKLRDGELESQLRKCQNNYKNVIVMIEGVFDELEGFLALYRASDNCFYRYKVFPNTRWSYVQGCIIRLSSMGIEIIETSDFPLSMNTIKLLYNQRTKPEKDHHLFKYTRRIAIPTKLTSDPTVSRLMSLIPRLPEKTAIRMVHRFGSLLNIILASDEELMEVEGVSKITVNKLRDIMTYVHNDTKNGKETNNA